MEGGMAYTVDPRVDAVRCSPRRTAGHGNTTAGTVAYRQGETVHTGALGEMFRQIIAGNREGGRRKLEQR
jgi:hypothetical protein